MRYVCDSEPGYVFHIGPQVYFISLVHVLICLIWRKDTRHPLNHPSNHPSCHHWFLAGTFDPYPSFIPSSFHESSDTVRTVTLCNGGIVSGPVKGIWLTWGMKWCPKVKICQTKRDSLIRPKNYPIKETQNKNFFMVNDPVVRHAKPMLSSPNWIQ